MAPFVEQRVRANLGCDPLTARRRDAAEASLRRCYEAAGLPLPGTVVWVASPLVADAAARAAAATLRQCRADAAARARPWPVRAWDAVRAAIDRALRWTVTMLVCTLAGAVTIGLFVGCAASDNMEDDRAAWLIVGAIGAAGGALAGACAGLAYRRHVRIDATQTARRALLNAATGDINDTGRRIRAACVDDIERLLADEVTPRVDDLVHRGVLVPVADAVTPVWTAIGTGVRLGTVRDRPELFRYTERAARAAAGPDGPSPGLDRPSRLDNLVAQRDSGQLARLAWWRRHGGVTVDGWDRFDAFAEACRFWWWPHPDFVVVSRPPVELSVERSASGAYQVHRGDGPAVVWRHGFRLYFWRGVEVPADLIERGWGVDRIHQHDNSEVRRAAIEHMGWLTYIKRAGLRVVASAPDPGNHPHALLLSRIRRDGWATRGSW
jgi:hypothetical protein